ncbi:unnamed protein product [Prorocentrum cordatum]|uniref:Uncharacterized protein n=1 Tax=Prorocentrum cordatum TaxID=2364126 RepID=A0ABN9XHK5_9DINO|nr:unnamed protein product [Polarella glacialis]
MVHAGRRRFTRMIYDSTVSRRALRRGVRLRGPVEGTLVVETLLLGDLALRSS